MAEAHTNTRWFYWLSSGATILLTLEVVLLIKQNRDLEATVKSFTSTTEPEPLKPGDRVEPVMVRSMEGNTLEITYADPTKTYLLFVFSTSCPHCEKTLVQWKKIASANDGGICTIIGISTHNLEKTQAYVVSRDVAFYVTSVLDDTSFSRGYKISAVPQTILIKGYASVEKVWIGELSDEQTSEIERLVRGAEAP